MNTTYHRLLRLCVIVMGCVAVACSPDRLSTSTSPLALSPSPLPTPTATARPTPDAAQPVPVYTYKIINTYPHDVTAFTEGLLWDGEALYESTGLNGQSMLRRVDLTSGKVLQNQPLDPKYFGEGLTLWGDQLIQLTWKSHTGFVYDKTSFKLLKTFSYPMEGWGLTHDDTRLIMSDGTSTLYFLDPTTLAEVGHLDITAQGQPVRNLNELEVVRGEIWANIWQTDRIARIDPASGRVSGWIDLTGLLSAADRQRGVDVLNGIAYDAAHDRVFVTGKLWPKLFEIEIMPKP
jgi:glutamine cyclotransferase